jgi:hypothetical protein
MVELVDTQDLKSCSRKRSAGSIPALSTNPDAGASGFCVKMSTYTNAKVAQLVEHDLAKVGVASSNLVFRSNPFPKKGFIVKSSGGGTGRHAGLKILFPSKECGFDSRPEYFKNRHKAWYESIGLCCYISVGSMQRLCWGENPLCQFL